MDLIDRVLSKIFSDPRALPIVSKLQSAEISAVIDLISELPSEFIVLSGSDYSEYRVSINGLKVLLRSGKISHRRQLPIPKRRRAFSTSKLLASC